MTVPAVLASGIDSGFAFERSEGVLFQGREGLEVTIEVGGRSGIVGEAAAGGIEVGFDGVDPVGLDAVVLEGNVDRDHDRYSDREFRLRLRRRSNRRWRNGAAASD